MRGTGICESAKQRPEKPAAYTEETNIEECTKLRDEYVTPLDQSLPNVDIRMYLCRIASIIKITIYIKACHGKSISLAYQKRTYITREYPLNKTLFLCIQRRHL